MVALANLNMPKEWDVKERRVNHDAIDEAVNRWTRMQDRDGVMAQLIAADIAVGNVVDPRLITSHPQMKARGYFERVAHPVVGDIDLPTLPFRFRSVDTWLRQPAPLFGQDNRMVLRQAGLDEAEIDALETDGIISDQLANL